MSNKLLITIDKTMILTTITNGETDVFAFNTTTEKIRNLLCCTLGEIKSLIANENVIFFRILHD